MATTMNKENNPAPRCPYCGAEMILEDNEDVLFGLFADEEKMYWYQCNTPSCGIQSPANHTKEGAYKAAMKRRQEPNRVLTLEEICTAEVCWTETPRASLEACRIVMREYTSFPEGKPAKSFDFYSTGETVPWCYRPEEYGVSVRCWLRKPTPEEMANTPWEAKHNEH